MQARIHGPQAAAISSDDGGTSFRLMTSRLASAGGRLYVDPKNPDVVYTMGTSVYRSSAETRSRR